MLLTNQKSLKNKSPKGIKAAFSSFAFCPDEYLELFQRQKGEKKAI